MKRILDQYLYQEDQDEVINKHKQGQVMEPTDEIEGVKIVSEKESSLFVKGAIHVSKHPRYAKMKAHKHSFVEMNYMYSGSCVQYINGQKVVLKEGELLLMDKDTIHSIDALQEKDILVNIIFKEHFLSVEYLNELVQKQSIIFDFVVKATTHKENHQHFLILETKGNEPILHLLHSIMYHFFETDAYSLQIIRLTLPLLFIELSRQLDYQLIHKQENQTIMMEILSYIDTHYTNLTLTDLSLHFGFNRNYLSNKVKEETGLSFIEILHQKRLNMAIYFMRENQLSLEEIAYYIGYKSPSALFKLFKKYYHMSPLEYKKQFL